MNDSDRVSILAHSGLGYTANEPVALVISSLFASEFPLPNEPMPNSRLATRFSSHPQIGLNRLMTSPSMLSSHRQIGRRAEQGPTPFEVQYLNKLMTSPSMLSSHRQIGRRAEQGPTPFEVQYLYYQVYKNNTAVESKQPAHPDDPFVGHINADLVSPPHMAKTIIRCISKIEELSHSTDLDVQLFIKISSELPIGEGHVSILTSDRPGSTPEDPMAFVVAPTHGEVENTRGPYSQSYESLV